MIDTQFQTHIDRKHKFSIVFPLRTQSGKTVNPVREKLTGRHRIHTQTIDMQTVYFELVSYDTCVSHVDVINEMRAFLTNTADDGGMSKVSKTILGKIPATTFSFMGMLQGFYKVRRFYFFDAAGRTYRIALDPRSAVNFEILDTLTFLEL